jgi:glycosyltransferase involved in cell wall biosynthesis
MKETSLISIIIPAYNCSKTLSRAVRSALRQTYRNIEIIVVDDGSTDGTTELCDTIASEDQRIQVIHKKNGRQASARNAGLRVSKGQYILFLDSDDEYVPNLCETVLKAIEPNTDFVLYGFNIYQMGKLLRTPNPGNARYEDDNGDVFKMHVMRLMASPCNKFYRRDYIKEEFDELCVHSEDSIFNYSNFCKGVHIKTISECLYNVHLDNQNSVNKSYQIGRLVDVIKNIHCSENKINEVFGLSKDLLIKETGGGVARLLSEVYMLSNVWKTKASVKQLKSVLHQNTAQSILKEPGVEERLPFKPLRFFLRHRFYTTAVYYCGFLYLCKTVTRSIH